MEKTSEYWSHQQYLHPLSPNPSLLGRPFGVCQLNNEPVSRNSYFVNGSTLRTVPSFSVPGLQPLKANEPNNSSNWFHGLPRSQQAFTFALNSTPGFAPVQENFFVFDQSGDKTTVIYSSGVETSILHGMPQKYPTAYDLIKDGPGDGIYYLSPITSDEQKEDKSRDVMEDEIHEDTEELNALLYSDSDSYFSEDDEEMSTGHSPSIMTDNGIRDLVEETGEEVDSFAGPTKKRKLLDGGFDVLLRNSLKTRASSVSEDAESSCGHEKIMENLGSSLSSCKRSKKERIRETVSILQSIIPSVSEKDVVGVIDGAIHYLRSLKVKAKALGLDTL